MSFGTWWGADPDAGEQGDVDVIAAGKLRRSLICGECASARRRLGAVPVRSSHILQDVLMQGTKNCRTCARRRMFRPKAYDGLVEWKRGWRGRTALLLEGARRVGKTTPAREFAERAYRSAISIDSSTAPSADKLCAMLETRGGRPSSRVKDLVDVLAYATTQDLDGAELARRPIPRPA